VEKKLYSFQDAARNLHPFPYTTLTKVMVRSGTFRSLKELGEEEIISKS
jgi:hypothetical protein